MDQRALPAIQSSALGGLGSRRVLGGTGAVTAAAMIASASVGETNVVTLAATIFALTAAMVAVVFCLQALRWPPSQNAPMTPAFVAMRDSSLIAAICYAWGAVAMQGVYLTSITGLRWQHGWQYAMAMVLLAMTSLTYARAVSATIRDPAPTGTEWPLRWAAPLATAQACIAGGGLIALAYSGKLFSMRADWAANRVFAALAVAILTISVASIVAHRHFTKGRHTT